MFHGKHPDDQLDRAARWAGLHLGPPERRALDDFGRWLADEGVESGGVGPIEGPRIVDRHLADSLVFAGVWGATPSRVLDVGSGVGLPGIPLAITHPLTDVTLLDRSGRRCRLARRVVRILGLSTITNINDPDNPLPATVEDIIAVAKNVAPMLEKIIQQVVENIHEETIS